MAVTINASTSAGLISTADTSGILQLQTANTAALTINASQNVTFAGSQTLSGGTANGVTYLNGSKVLTSGSALQFNGSQFGVNTTPSQAIDVVTDGASSVIRSTAYRAADGQAGINLRFARGSVASPTIVLNGDTIGTMEFYPYNGTNFNLQTALISAKVTGTVTTSNIPTSLVFSLDAAGSAFSNEQMRLTSTGLGIGTSSPAAKLDVRAGTGATLLVSADATNLVALNNYNSTSGFQDFKYAGSTHQFFTGTAGGGSVSERARIDSSGNLLVGTTNTNPGGSDINGIALRPGGFSVISALGATPFGINRGTDDGTLINFSQAGSTEGSISVSGTTVSYNGGHLSRWAQTTTTKDESLVKGTVLSNLDEMNVYTKDGQPVANEQLNKVKVSDTEGDANVAGVFVNWSHDEDHNVDEINMAMTGDMIIRIAQGVTVVRGDLLMSAGNGTAKPQGDDIVRSKTVAKVTSNHITCTYADGSYCVPCVLMAC